MLLRNALTRLSFLLLSSLAGLAPAAWAGELTVSAASSLSNAFKELAPGFEAQQPGSKLLFNFAASDALLAQIAKGAPVDVFAAADQISMDRAQAQGLLAPGSRRNFTRNQLVLISAAGVTPPKSLADLQGPAFTRLALGRPEGVPAGRYAKSALEAAGLWTALAPKAVYAQNVRQALDYVARGEAEAGIVYATDAAQAADKVKTAFSIPTAEPILYPAAIVSGSAKAKLAGQFLSYLQSPGAQAVLARHGFLAP